MYLFCCLTEKFFDIWESWETILGIRSCAIKSYSAPAPLCLAFVVLTSTYSFVNLIFFLHLSLCLSNSLPPVCTLWFYAMCRFLFSFLHLLGKTKHFLQQLQLLISPKTQEGPSYSPNSEVNRMATVFSVTLHTPNDPFNDLDDPFLHGHKNLTTELPDENQSISVLFHGFHLRKLIGYFRLVVFSCALTMFLCGSHSFDFGSVKFGW